MRGEERSSNDEGRHIGIGNAQGRGRTVSSGIQKTDNGPCNEWTYAGSARAGVGVPTFVILYVVNDTSRLHHSSVLKRHGLGWVVNLSISIRRQSHDCSVVCKTLIAYDRVSHKKISARYSSISDSNLFLLSQTLNDVQYLSRPSRTLSAPPPPSLSFHNW